MKELKKLILMTAEYYGKNLSMEIIGMYASDLKDLPLEEIKKAYETYRRNPKNVFNPLPAQIRAIIHPPENENYEGIHQANRIWEAIGHFGWCNSDRAEVFLGPELWKVVKRYGGWFSICKEANQSDPGIFKAQLRESCKATTYYAKRKPDQKAIEGTCYASPGLLKSMPKEDPEDG